MSSNPNRWRQRARTAGVLGALAVVSVALSGCIVVPRHGHGYGYGQATVAAPVVVAPPAPVVVAPSVGWGWWGGRGYHGRGWRR